MDIREPNSPTGDSSLTSAASLSPAAENAALQRMGVRVGELGLLFPWDGGREVILAPPTSRIPNTVSWLRGVANVRGGLVPVVDTAAAFGVPRATGLPTYMLIFGHGESSIGLLIDGLPRLLSVGESQRMSDLPDGIPLLESGVHAAYQYADRVWIDVDLERLFENFARHIAV